MFSVKKDGSVGIHLRLHGDCAHVIVVHSISSILRLSGQIFKIIVC
uniref:Uncharacterized protein n=1 Tax=Anguilla anguilla TaxID=7936 RepID=A0A0E9SD80_ANGAN